jgi:hypothetical protein
MFSCELLYNHGMKRVNTESKRSKRSEKESPEISSIPTSPLSKKVSVPLSVITKKGVKGGEESSEYDTLATSPAKRLQLNNHTLLSASANLKHIKINTSTLPHNVNVSVPLSVTTKKVVQGGEGNSEYGTTNTLPAKQLQLNNHVLLRAAANLKQTKINMNPRKLLIAHDN